MTTTTPRRRFTQSPRTGGDWLGMGIVVAVVGVVAGAATGEPLVAFGLGAVGGIPATIGMIALGVQIGNRATDYERERFERDPAS